MNQEFYINLIIKKLSGEISENETKELNTWLKESPQHQQMLEELEQSWQYSNHYKKDYLPNTMNAWQKVNSSLERNKNVVPLKSFQYKWASIAATVLILITVGWLTFTSNNKTVTIASTNKETTEVTLPDGSFVALNENTKISYNKKFKHRKIYLEGEAYFDVQHNTRKPFSVKTKSTETVVLGTTFNVSSYKNENTTNVDLFTGKVAFKANNEEVILQPGEKVSFNKALAKISKSKIENQNVIAWKTGTLLFDESPLIQVIESLEKQYNVKFDLQLPANQNCVFTGEFKNISIEKVIEILSFTYELTYKKTDNQISLSIKNCN